jgi:hypothetical protein
MCDTLYDARIVPPEEGELHQRSPRKSNVELDRLAASVEC